MRKLRWSTGLTLVFVLALFGTAAAKPPPSDPPVPPVVTIDSLELYCGESGHLAVDLTVSADDQTRLDFVGVGIREVKFVKVGTGGYFPYDTMLGVAQWSGGVDSGEGPGKPTAGLANPTTFTLNTVDGTDHYWNTLLSDGTPAADSWFEVHASGYGNSTHRDGGWAGTDRTDFINCTTDAVMIDANQPWEDWNYPEEG